MNLNRVLHFVALSAVLLGTASAQKNSCSNGIPVTVTVASLSTALQPDGKGAYVDGVGGVIARIYCYDFSLSVSSSKNRGFTVQLSNANFLDAVYNDTPSWATTGTPAAGIGIHVANILCLSAPSLGYNACAPGQNTFTTRASILFATPTKPSSASYNVVYRSPSAFAATYATTDENLSCDDSTVTVMHYPAAGTAKESWTVTVDPSTCAINGQAVTAQAATLESSSVGNSGQFSVPMMLMITRL
jgi:hypothetical protein